MVALVEQVCYNMNMTNDDPEFNYGLLTPEQAQARYDTDIEVLNRFYEHSFNMDEYMPVVKDGIEEQLNSFQFILNYIHSNPYIPPADKGLMSMWITQAAFWLGYKEAQKASVGIPDVFKSALGE